VVLSSLAIPVRLQIFNRRSGQRRDTVQPVPPQLHFESGLHIANGKRVLVGRQITVGEDEFPNQVIERRPEIVEYIPDDERDSRRDCCGNSGFDDGSVRLAVCLTRQFSGMIPQKPKSFGLQNL
jgi:hypothetical protein